MTIVIDEGVLRGALHQYADETADEIIALAATSNGADEKESPIYWITDQGYALTVLAKLSLEPDGCVPSQSDLARLGLWKPEEHTSKRLSRKQATKRIAGHGRKLAETLKRHGLVRILDGSEGFAKRVEITEAGAAVAQSFITGGRADQLTDADWAAPFR